MIRTRIAAVDCFLGGGLVPGTLLDIYGPGGAGKTQALLQIAAGAAGEGHAVWYVDAAGDFRPERVLEMGADYAALERIRVCRATSVAEQVESVRRLGDASVILIDNVTDLFAYEYYRKHTRPAGNRRLAGHLRELSMLALDWAVPIVLTNMIRYSGSGQVESLAHIVDLYTHFKLYLEGAPECSGRIGMAGRQERFGYRVGSAGVMSSG